MEQDKLVKWIADNVQIHKYQLVKSRAMVSYNIYKHNYTSWNSIQPGAFASAPEDFQVPDSHLDQVPVNDMLPRMVCSYGETIMLDGDYLTRLMAHIQTTHPGLDDGRINGTKST